MNLMTVSFDTLAGMPMVLPFESETYQRLSGSFSYRLQALSFFIVGLFLCAGLVALLWNYSRKDFPQLPRLHFGSALAITTLWGLLFVIVLTMISGARELMTPGAWQQNGYTYSLTTEQKSGELNKIQLLRKHHLEKLRTVLWHHAATHQGKFPLPEDYAAVANNLWIIPQAAGMRYLYQQGLSANADDDILVYEPELENKERLVLLTNGEIVSLTTAEIIQKLGGDKDE